MKTQEKAKDAVTRLGKGGDTSMVFLALSIFPGLRFCCDQVSSHGVMKNSSNKTLWPTGDMDPKEIQERRHLPPMCSHRLFSCDDVLVFFSFQTAPAPGANAGTL
jgi:hypothetical protein